MLTNCQLCRIEAEGKQIEESVMKDALALAHSSIQEIIQAQVNYVQQELISQQSDLLNKKSKYSINQQLYTYLHDNYFEEIKQVYTNIDDSFQQKDVRSELEGKFRSKVLNEIEKNPMWLSENGLVKAMTVDTLIHKAFRESILTPVAQTSENGEMVFRRSDGRQLNQIRPIGCLMNTLPFNHGSAYFSRGDTHVLSSVTLGPHEDCRKLFPTNGSGKERLDYFMLHYDFPPYCTGELGVVHGTNRRMVGHGNLAEKSIKAVLPTFEEFPYTVRVFSECTSSNGSSSMASACGATLSLIDAGVPIKEPVAGISVGLITDESYAQPDLNGIISGNGRYKILTDILGSEDHHGDMDFKVTGTKNGITAIQLDVKLPGGVPVDILNEALDKAKDGRMEILSHINLTIEQSKHQHQHLLKSHLPKAELLKVDIERISQLIGPNGEMISFIRNHYDIVLEIFDEKKGLIYLYGKDPKKVKEAKSLIQDIAIMIKENEIIPNAMIMEVRDFGLILKINKSQVGLLHISEISHDKEILKKPLSELFRKGQKLNVKVIQVDKMVGLYKLSRKVLLPPPLSTGEERDVELIKLIENKDIDPSSSSSSTVEEDDEVEKTIQNIQPPKKWSKSFFR